MRIVFLTKLIIDVQPRSDCVTSRAGLLSFTRNLCCTESTPHIEHLFGSMHLKHGHPLQAVLAPVESNSETKTLRAY